jgi:hypothetical protein
MTLRFNHCYNFLSSKCCSTVHCSSKHMELLVCPVISCLLCQCALVLCSVEMVLLLWRWMLRLPLSITQFPEGATFRIVPSVCYSFHCAVTRMCAVKGISIVWVVYESR